MDAEKKAAWVKALRSGEYTQTREVLYDNRANGYCCLGVYLKLQGFQTNPLTGFEHLGKDWTLHIPLTNSSRNHLIDMNDTQGKSFSEIADWIEGHL